MSVIDTEVHPHHAGDSDQPPIVNDFAMVAATVNSSGSQTANNVLIRAMFKMGIPVCGKNLFPSNIQGLPTWYTIRVSKDGYTARRDETEILVAFNAKTADENLAALPAGGVCLHPDDQKFAARRDDVVYYPLPVKELVKQSGAAGAVEALITALALREGRIPPTINYAEPDPAFDLDYVPNQARALPICVALSNSIGLGGHNSCLALKQFVL